MAETAISPLILQENLSPPPRVGLDPPDISLVAIRARKPKLDADEASTLRRSTPRIETIGCAPRNVNGTVILCADAMTDSH
jgi:excinuclease UvrABC helicase subunit UvrB